DVQSGAATFHTAMTPIQELQWSSAQRYASTMYCAFCCSVTRNHEYSGWIESLVQPNSTSQTCFRESLLRTMTSRSCSTRRNPKDASPPHWGFEASSFGPIEGGAL